MEQLQKKGITGSELKFLAILAMLIDHIAWSFIPIDTVAAQLMHAIGRITAPVMCFFISEGFHYTKSFKKYMGRMCVFALISHFAYNYYNSGSPFKGQTESVISTLTLCLLTLWVVNHEKIAKHIKLVLVILLLFLAEYCDWGAVAVLFTLAFEFGRGDRKQQIIAYTGICVVTKFIPMIEFYIHFGDLILTQLFIFGLLLPIPLLMLYNGEKGGGKATKWIFYIFYPAHLVFLGYLYFNY